LSKLPDRKRRKWKGQIRRDSESRDKIDENGPVFEHHEASSGSGASGNNRGAVVAAAGEADSPGFRNGYQHREKYHGESDGKQSASDGAAPSESRHEVTKNTRAGFGPGERADAPLVADGSQSVSARAHGKKRKGRGRGANVAAQQARGIRAPVRPVPDAAYSPVAGTTGNPAKGKPGRHAGRFETQNSQALQNRSGDGNRIRSDSASVTGQSAAHTQTRSRGQVQGQSRGPAREQALYAALDLGTNNCRLLVAVPQERGRFRVIDGFSKIVRLGEGLGQSGSLSEPAMERALAALKICGEKLAGHNIRRHRLIATEACRQADNGQAFLDRVKTETGMSLEIVDRQTEAYLAAEGCGALMDRKADAAVLFDIGGGSSELVLVNQRIRKKRISDQIVSWTSVPIGVVTLAERHGGKTVNGDVFRNMIDEVKAHLNDFPGRNNLEKIWKNGKVHLLGTSGTVTTLAGVHLNLPRYDRRQVDGLWMSAGQIDAVIADLLAMDYRQRALSPCVGAERADLVMAGCAILEAIRETWPSERLRVADCGLREGILTQMMERDAAWLAPKRGRWRSNTGKPRNWSKSKQGKTP